MPTNEQFCTNRYTVAFSAKTLSTAGNVNVFPFLSGDTHCVFDSIDIGFVTTSAVSGANFAMMVYRGSTTPVSTAAAVTPTPVNGWTGHAAADCTVSAPTTNLPSTTSASLLYAQASDLYCLHTDTVGCSISPQQRLDVIVTPLQAGTYYGTLSFTVRGNGGF